MMFIVFLVIDLLLAGFMLYQNSIEDSGCWNVPSLHDIMLYTCFGLIVFPFWFIRFILLLIEARTV